MKKRKNRIRKRHRALASHTKDLHLAFFRKVRKMRPRARYDALVAKIRSLGWGFIHIHRTNFTRDFWLRSITLHQLVILGKDWLKKSLISRCEILAHELMHIFQRIRLGRVLFVAYYAFAPWRWGLEASAYRITQYFTRGSTQHQAEWMYDSGMYKFGRIRRKEFVEETVAILAPWRTAL